MNYEEIDDFVNAEIDDEREDKINYVQHIKQLFEKRPLSIDIEEEHQEEKEIIEEDKINLDSLSKKALDSKQVEEDEGENEKEPEFFSKSNFPLNPRLENDPMVDSKDRLPGSVPDLEPEMNQFQHVITKFDNNIDDFLNDTEENLIPENFGEMLDGKHKDMEKVVYFSTLNSQDNINSEVEQIKDNEEDHPEESEIQK